MCMVYSCKGVYPKRVRSSPRHGDIKSELNVLEGFEQSQANKESSKRVEFHLAWEEGSVLECWSKVKRKILSH